jgi:ribonuclease HII
MAPYEWSIPGLADSKELTENQRYELTCQLYAERKAGRIALHVVQADSDRIDEIGVQTALRKCHVGAIAAVSDEQGHTMCVADGDLLLPGDIVSMPKADTFVPQVMAASIVAKHVRDSFMKDMATYYPHYSFEKHVGYGTKEHYAAIEKLGPCDLHRRSYAPFREDKHARRDGAYSSAIPEASGEPSSGQPDAGDPCPVVHPKRKSLGRAKRKASG